MNISDLTISMIKKNKVLIDEEEKIINVKSELSDIAIEEMEDGLIKISCDAEKINYLNGDTMLKKLMIDRIPLSLHSKKEILKDSNVQFNIVDLKVHQEWGNAIADIFFKLVN